MYQHIVKAGETLWAISEDYRVPFSDLVRINNISNPNYLFIGQKITIPGLPDPNQIPYSIFVSTGQRKLTLRRNGTVVKTYPIAVGKMLTTTPVGEFVIINKAPNPGGPFGTMWMSLSKKSYGIHGTNNPSSIGKAVSKGCIRMYNKDVEELAKTIPVGTRVMISP
ncbi:LysM peptidoglycan-binding domain-containing protein [Bacillus salacetis]|uniref:LysM peptidoglycan-binding domain-containing protein n=1 Tax=Bacillus salacetis TaxID=2315464 RepID=A0A3A1R672_9BACI|nr:L,D-transpeptidase family protein [Bacillus salacetis]RIW38505.1 LysM peptidoglycan-binding domain-containing protein [Bacillus salacetis]